ncbi:hypothetical protein [Gandjariella thermophila]|uniref:MDMPI C-terminal domain-containing protein n=1 Tax=Gandjariella thermophila TaxID=1931992 RepID=A0A4D4JB41_9PSEU|nr:hypothetical protein [Gandjariella thermophila]GDY31177.1 hypothetical protein GTS_28100 [Gandjariella thermophila]
MVSATDAGRYWLVRLGPHAPRTTETPEPVSAGTVISGAAADIYLALWNRRPWDGVAVTGDDDLPARWSDAVRVRWA